MADKSAQKPRKSTRDAEGSIIKKVEEKRTSGGKTRKETVYYARVRYTDNHGIKREKKRRADSYTDAVILRRQLKDDVKRELAEELEVKPKLFSEVLDFYRQEYVKEAEYSGNQKIAGLREPLKYIERHLEMFRKMFGHKLISKITYDDIRKYKEERLKTPVVTEYIEKVELTEEEKKNFRSNKKYKFVTKKKSRPRAVASVHRELERLRRIFNIAVQQQWLDKSPFQLGDSLISHAQETERVRILTPDEEKRLLAQAVGKRAHLKPILIAALDTCLRKNELFTLTWKDIDFEKNVITVQALNAKTLKSRMVPISKRLKAELEKLKSNSSTQNDLVFGILSSPKKAFYKALDEARISDFRFHDLRGTGITRFLRAGMEAAEVMKISGHTQWATFMRYVKIDSDTMSRSKSALDAYLEKIA